MNKTILIDFGNLSKRCLYSEHCKVSDTVVDYDVWRGTIFNSIYCSILRFKPNRVVIAMDDHSWRKIIYDPYKLDRRIKVANDIKAGKPQLNWEEVNEVMETFAFEISQNLPFQTLKIKSCEADDIIGTISLQRKNRNYVIISADSDFKQLLRHKHIKVYEPMKKLFASCDDPDDFLFECYIRGQSKDNIYNVFTSLDFPLEGLEDESGEIYKFRKPPLGEQQYRKIADEIGLDKGLDVVGPSEVKKKNAKIITENEKRKTEKKPLQPLLNEDLRRRYDLNRKLIDLECTPDILKKRILTGFDSGDAPDPAVFYSFFKRHGGRNALENYDKIEQVLLSLY